MSTRTGADQLRGRTIRGVGWNLMGSAARALLQVGVLVLLARLVTPEEFGVAAAALVVVTLLSLVAAVGLGPSLVQLRGLTEEHVRVAWSSFVLLGAGLWALATWQAAMLASLLGIPALTSVIPWLATVLVVRNLTVGDWLLQRRLDFRTLAMVELQSYGIGFGVVAVGLALRGHGVGAIVAGHVVQAVTRTVLLVVRAPHTWRPLLRWAELRELLVFGGGHVLGRLLGRLAVQGDNLVVARWLGPVALGLYTRAYQLMVLPSELLGGAANQVLFPSLASVQDDRPRLAHAYRTGSVALAVVTVPVAVVAAVVAPELVQVVLGPDWSALVPAFRVMAAGIVLRTVYKVGDALVQAVGHVYRRAVRLAVYAAAVIGGALVGSRWGITGVATATLAALLLHAAQMTHLALRVTESSWRRFLAAHVPAVLTGAVTLVVVAPATSILRAAGVAAPWVVLVAGASLAATGLAVLRLAPAIGSMATAASLCRDVLATTSGRARAIAVRLAGPRYRPDDGDDDHADERKDPDHAAAGPEDEHDRRPVHTRAPG